MVGNRSDKSEKYISIKYKILSVFMVVLSLVLIYESNIIVKNDIDRIIIMTKTQEEEIDELLLEVKNTNEILEQNEEAMKTISMTIDEQTTNLENENEWNC